MEATVTKEMRFRKVKHIPTLKEASPYLIGGVGLMKHAVDFMKIEDFGKMNWNVESIVDGLNYLIELEQTGSHLFPVYSREECRADHSKKPVNLLHFPAKKTGKPFVVLCAGGAYMSVCSAAEGYPVAKVFNELGYPAFVLNYRVGGSDLMPKPLDDLAAALRYIRSRAEEFHVDPDRYIVCGFSAGGNLTALWGTENHGYKTYGLPAPEALFPIYPAVSPKLWGASDNKAVAAFQKTMFGKDPSDEILREYDALEHIGADYPPSYIVCCRDDDTVPPVNSEALKKVLDGLRIPAVLEIGEHGGHGFGEGRGTGAEGWIERAAAFAESVRREREE